MRSRRACPERGRRQPVYRDFRPGDVRHSQADIGKARRLLGYAPTHRLADGIRAALPWYLARHGIVPEPEGRFAGADMNPGRHAISDAQWHRGHAVANRRVRNAGLPGVGTGRRKRR